MSVAAWLAIGTLAPHQAALAQAGGQPSGAPAAAPAAAGTAEAPLFGEKPRTQQQQQSDRKAVDDAIKRLGSKAAAADDSVKAGWQALGNGDAAGAVHRFNLAWLIAPEGADAYWGLAAASSMQGDNAAALRLFDRAYAINQKDPRMLADRAYAYVQSAAQKGRQGSSPDSDLDAALKWFDAALMLEPNLAIAHANRSIALYYKGLYDEAWSSLNKAETLDPSSIDPQFKAELQRKAPR